MLSRLLWKPLGLRDVCWLIVLSALAGGSVFGGPAVLAQEPRPRVAALEIQNGTDTHLARLSESSEQALIDALTASDCCEVLPRPILRQRVLEQRLMLHDIDRDLDAAVAVGLALGVDFLVTGRVVDYQLQGSEHTLTSELVIIDVGGQDTLYRERHTAHRTEGESRKQHRVLLPEIFATVRDTLATRLHEAPVIARTEPVDPPTTPSPEVTTPEATEDPATVPEPRTVVAQAPEPPPPALPSQTLPSQTLPSQTLPPPAESPDVATPATEAPTASEPAVQEASPGMRIRSIGGRQTKPREGRALTLPMTPPETAPPKAAPASTAVARRSPAPPAARQGLAGAWSGYDGTEMLAYYFRSDGYLAFFQGDGRDMGGFAAEFRTVSDYKTFTDDAGVQQIRFRWGEIPVEGSWKIVQKDSRQQLHLTLLQQSLKEVEKEDGTYEMRWMPDDPPVYKTLELDAAPDWVAGFGGSSTPGGYNGSNPLARSWKVETLEPHGSSITFREDGKVEWVEGAGLRLVDGDYKFVTTEARDVFDYRVDFTQIPHHLDIVRPEGVQRSTFFFPALDKVRINWGGEDGTRPENVDSYRQLTSFEPSCLSVFAGYARYAAHYQKTNTVSILTQTVPPSYLDTARPSGIHGLKPLGPEHCQATQRYLEMFFEEFVAKYPPSLILGTGLWQIVLVADIDYVDPISNQAQDRAGVPDVGNSILYYDIFEGCAQRTPEECHTIQRHFLHHELFHYLELKWQADLHRADADWEALNPAGFTYPSSGGSGCYLDATQRAEAWKCSPQVGFVMGYSRCAVEEDKSDLFAMLMAGQVGGSEAYCPIAQILANDPAVAAKAKLLAESYGQLLRPRWPNL